MILDIMFLTFQPKILPKIIKNLKVFSSDHLIFFKESWSLKSMASKHSALENMQRQNPAVAAVPLVQIIDIENFLR